MTLEEEMRRAAEARSLLDHPLMVEARRNVERQLETCRQRVPIGDTVMHTKLIMMEQLWGQLTGFLEQLAQTGQFAQFHLRQEERRKSLLEQGVLLFKNFGRGGL